MAPVIDSQMDLDVFAIAGQITASQISSYSLTAGSALGF